MSLPLSFSLHPFPSRSAVIFMHCCIVKYFAFNCTPDWSILFGALFAWQIFRSAGRQAGSFSIFPLPPLASPPSPLHLSASGAVLLTAVVVFGLAIFVYICCLALARSICCFWNIFNKTLYAFHFCNNCAALSSGI